MNFSIFRNLQSSMCSFASKILTSKTLPVNQVGNRGIHQICSQYSSTLNSTSQHQNFLFKSTNLLSSMLKPTSFLVPTLPQFNQVCGLKVKGHLIKRCKGCYFVARGGLLYVMCKLKPRHKQVQMHKSWKKTQILTFAHQKPKREW